jgi:hypothetical protein
MNQDPPRRDYVRDFDDLWGSAEGCWEEPVEEDESQGYADMAQTLLNNAEEHEHIMYDRNGNTHRVGEVDGKFALKTERLGADRLCFNRVYYTDEHGVDHPVKSYEFSYYYENGERVLFNGDLYDVYALCEPTYILRDPTGSVMSSVKVTESDLEKVDV